MGWVYRREGSINYWLAYHDAKGKLVRRTAGTTNKLLAEEKLAEIEGKVLAQETAAEIGVQESAATGSGEPSSGASLETRVKNLEIVVRRICLYHAFQARMFQFWGRHAERLMPSAAGEANFFNDMPEGDETP